MPFATLEPVDATLLREAEMGGLLKSARKGIKRVGSQVKRSSKYIVRKKLKILRKAAPIVLPVAGAVLAPFTGGASLAIAALGAAAVGMYDARKTEKEMLRKAEKQEAIYAAAEAKQYEAQLDQQTRAFYGQYSDYMQKIGWSQSAWNALSAEDRLAAIEAFSKGNIVRPGEYAPPPSAKRQAEERASTAAVSVPTRRPAPKPAISRASVVPQGRSTMPASRFVDETSAPEYEDARPQTASAGNNTAILMGLGLLAVVAMTARRR